MEIGNIWLIDDDPMNNVFNSYLIQEHFPDVRIECFLYAGDALKELAKFPKSRKLPDLIFLDITMPIINGWEFLSLCQERFPGIKYRSKIYMLSSSENLKDKLKAEEHPLVSGFLSKPLQNSYLIELIKEHQMAHRS